MELLGQNVDLALAALFPSTYAQFRRDQERLRPYLDLYRQQVEAQAMVRTEQRYSRMSEAVSLAETMLTGTIAVHQGDGFVMSMSSIDKDRVVGEVVELLHKAVVS